MTGERDGEPWRGNAWTEVIVRELLAWKEDRVSRYGLSVIVHNKVSDAAAHISRKTASRGGGTRLKHHLNAVIGLLHRQGVIRRELLYVDIVDRLKLEKVYASKDLFEFMGPRGDHE